MKVYVIGDMIIDKNRICHATRLCQEAPAPVLIESNCADSAGGAGLVHRQLTALLGENDVLLSCGSFSRKERIFADGHLICRLDYDSTHVLERGKDHLFERSVVGTLKTVKPGILVISDYGKGSFTASSAQRIMQAANILDVLVLVDAKHNWLWYPKAYAYFPNQNETFDLAGTGRSKSSHIIQKLGDRGCTVDGTLIPPEDSRDVKDSTGAGDIFIAAFAAKMTRLYKWNEDCGRDEKKFLTACAKFANRVAGKSVEYLGTKVIEGEIV